MKLIYKGRFKGKDQLPKGVLPPNAVKFREPNSLVMVNVIGILFLIPVLLLVILAVVLSELFHGAVDFNFSLTYIFITGALVLLSFFPHELLHAVCFGKGAEVELYVSPLAFFVTSTVPITKMRFIFLSLLPNLIFGVIPLLLWIALPYFESFSDVLFLFAVFSLCLGAGDYINVFNATLQMPKGSMQQLSGINSYWFMPENIS